MIKLYSVIYDVGELRAVPAGERTFFLAMTGLANDVQTLNRQLIVALNFDDGSKIVQQGAHSVAMLNARMLAGRMYEGWKNIRDHYPPISQIYDPLLSDPAKQAWDNLNQYFQRKAPRSLLAMVRDKFGFHSDLKIVAKNFDAFPDSAEMGEYISPIMGNTLYFSTELVHLQTLSNFCGNPDDPIAALDRLMNEAASVTRWINEFAFGFVHSFLALHFDEKLKAIPENLEEIDGQPSLGDLKLPYFVEFETTNKKRRPKRPDR